MQLLSVSTSLQACVRNPLAPTYTKDPRFQILGRASELNSFVKIGTESGYIEIELKGPKGKGNYVIRRNLTAKSKGSTFTLNGQSVTAREITAKVQELNVQVSNLWYAGILFIIR